MCCSDITLAAWCRVLPEKLLARLARKKRAKICCCVHECSPSDCVLSQMNPTPNPEKYFSKINFYVITYYIFGSSKWPFPSRFPTRISYAFLISACALYSPPVLSILIYSTLLYIVILRTLYEIPLYTVFCSFPSHHAS